MKKITMVSSIVCALAGPAFSYAPGSQTFGFQGGASRTNNAINWSSLGPGFENQRVADAGGAVGGQYIYYVAPAFGLGLDVNYSGLREHDDSDALPGLVSDSKFHPTTYLAIAKFSRPRGIVRPYLFGGLGGHTTTLSLSLAPQSGNIWSDTGTNETRQILDDTSSGFSAAFGLGLDFYLAPGLFIGGEYRFTYLGTTDYTVTQAGRDLGFSDAAHTDLSLSSFLVRIGMRFGAWPGGHGGAGD